MGTFERAGAAGGLADHAVQFYESDRYLCDTVSSFLAEGLEAGQPLVMFATDEHGSAILDRLAGQGVDVAELRRNGRLVLVDAREAISAFMVDRLPDAQRFAASVGGVVEACARRGNGAGVRAYGEMVDVLWRETGPAAAIRLEELWNELLAGYSVSLLCAYAMDSFSRAEHSRDFLEICHKHARVIPAERYANEPDAGARAREISRLQQRARALEAELEDRRRLEVALRQAKTNAEQATRIKSQFLAVMSHELRTPLNGILGYQDLLEQEVGGPITPAQRRYLGRIKAAAGDLLHLIDQLLDLARVEAVAEGAAVDTADALAIAAEATALLEPAAGRKGLTLSLAAPEGPVPCRADPVKLRQILLNLLSNAIKFTEQGSLELEVRLDDAVVAFEVRDTGVGIAPADLERIFQPFVQVDGSATRRYGGTGLGLAVSRDMARRLGGDIVVSSTPGAGSVFTLRVPAATPESATPDPTIAPA